MSIFKSVYQVHQYFKEVYQYLSEEVYQYSKQVYRYFNPISTGGCFPPHAQ